MKLLVSSCLLGEEVRYDGKSSRITSKLFEKLLKEHEIFSFCPEVEGGLSIPRPAAEIKGLQVLTKDNRDVSAFFKLGAKKALLLCQKENIKIALLKAKSPSCGNINIYDGNFRSILIDGRGICAQVLFDNNIQVFNEDQLKDLLCFIKDLELR